MERGSIKHGRVLTALGIASPETETRESGRLEGCR